ncbi:hypothetical protein PGIGA_G00170100 [Pangasianodon gigas]|uniref:Uncharacterized protein n=1 Tax=Pangasianodon gigas TaxID=30993 RepID=A0ACC5XUG5_PANGG|nr:hypothetical protein [Pangasianodon gigas]
MDQFHWLHGYIMSRFAFISAPLIAEDAWMCMLSWITGASKWFWIEAELEIRLRDAGLPPSGRRSCCMHCGVHTRALSSQHRNAERPSMMLVMQMAPLNDGSILRGLNNEHQSCWIQESKSGFSEMNSSTDQPESLLMNKRRSEWRSV